MDLCNPKEIKALLGRHGFHFSKSKGQNFLIQSWVPQQAAEASGAAPWGGGAGDRPRHRPPHRPAGPAGGEGGGGGAGRHPPAHPGGDHGPLSQRGDCPRRHFEAGPACLLPGALSGLPVVVCANLPYNITTPVITALLQSQCFQAVTVMIQREVAKRICAQPGTAEYRAFTLLCQYYAHCEVLFDVPPSCFLPAPQGDLLGDPHDGPGSAAGAGGGPGPLFPGGGGAFAQRRKTLINSLSSSLTDFVGKEEVTQALRACNLTETIRGERLTFCRLCPINGKTPRNPGS